jgi:hypothetical protein
MCHTDQQWTKALPLVLLGIRTSFKEDLQALVAELVYGEPLRIPGELLVPAAIPMDPALRAPPTHGPPQTDPSSTPRLPSYIRTRRLGKMHSSLLPQRRYAQSLGAPL